MELERSSANVAKVFSVPKFNSLYCRQLRNSPEASGLFLSRQVAARRGAARHDGQVRGAGCGAGAQLRERRQGPDINIYIYIFDIYIYIYLNICINICIYIYVYIGIDR